MSNSSNGNMDGVGPLPNPDVPNPVVQENVDFLRKLELVARAKRQKWADDNPNATPDDNPFNFLSNADFKYVEFFRPYLRHKVQRTDADIRLAVARWCNPATRDRAEVTYGHISQWDTSSVTDTSKLFCGDTGWVWVGEDKKGSQLYFTHL